MSQSGQPGAPQPGGAPPPPPPSWQSTPQPPAPPAGGPPPQQQPQMPSWANSMMDRTPVAGPAGYYYADVPNRVIAYIIDAIIVGIIGVIIGAILYGIFGSATTTTITGTTFNLVPLLVVAVVGIAVNAAYFIYTWVAMRGTVGMRLLGMQIGNETDGRTLTYNQAGIRWLVLFAPFALAEFLGPWPALGLLVELVVLIYLIVLLYTMAQSPTKQGLQDRYAHTMVVKAARMAG
jgi:uncharacterized RDD family membrane protein YckC